MPPELGEPSQFPADSRPTEALLAFHFLGREDVAGPQQLLQVPQLLRAQRRKAAPGRLVRGAEAVERSGRAAPEAEGECGERPIAGE